MPSGVRLQLLESDPALGANVVPPRSTVGLFSQDGTKGDTTNPKTK